MKKLSKEEMKKVQGGVMAVGACVTVFSDQHQSSCWYTNGDGADLCHRVYGSHCYGYSDPGPCYEGCTMN